MEVSGRRTDKKSQPMDREIFCQPCSSDGDWVVAKGYCQNCNELFCAACLKPHRKQSVTRHHVIIEGKSMTTSHAPEAHVDSCSELCSKHSNEIVKFFCASHDIIGCCDCMFLEHTVCKVERIQDISSKYFNSPEHRQINGKVEFFLKQLKELRTSTENTVQEIKATYSRVVADIKAFRKEVNDYIDGVEAEILTEVNVRKEKDKKTVSKLEADLSYVQHAITELEDKLKLQSNKANELFVAAKGMKDRMATFDRTIKQMEQAGQILQFRFEKSSELKLAVSSKVPLGKLTSINGCSQQKIADMEPRFDGEICIKAPEDKSDCYVIASALISPSKIVLADYHNKCVKLVDTDQGVIIDRYELCDGPEDVTLLNEPQIAVNFRNKQKIQVLSITKNGTFIESHDIKVNCNVRKIACQSGNLIIAYSNIVEILNNSGTVVTQVKSSDFTWIVNIAVGHDCKTFYVSNSAYNGKPTAIYKFDVGGNVLAKYEDNRLVDVRGLAVTPGGTVLVCNWTEYGSMHMISPECKKIKEILQNNEHIQNPYSVSFCNQTNKLLVCNANTALDPKQKNFLKIFQMM